MAKIISINRKARFNYEILETLEAGVELKGYEVKAIKTGHINLAGAFVAVKNREVQLLNANVPPYQPANTPDDYDPTRTRRLLLSAKEIDHLAGRTQEKGLTIVPLKVYTKGGIVKVEIGLGRSKRKVDKREKIKRQDIEREIGQKLKN